MSNTPVGLIILDGWGIRDGEAFNAPVLAKTPNFDAMMQRFATAQLSASGSDVGLPEGQIGNSEVCLLYTSPSPRDRQKSRMPSSA